MGRLKKVRGCSSLGLYICKCDTRNSCVSPPIDNDFKVTGKLSMGLLKNNPRDNTTKLVGSLSTDWSKYSLK